MFKKISLILALALAGHHSFSQEKKNTVFPNDRHKGSLELGIYGGLSQPLGEYGGVIGTAHTGWSGALDVDYYWFANNRLGISVGLLHQQHRKDTIVDNGRYSFPIKNGYTTFTQESTPGYRQTGLLIGPIFKAYENTKLEVSTYVRLGLVNQHNPDFYQIIYAYNPYNSHYVNVDMPYFSYNYDAPAITIMPNIGLKVHYKLNNHLGLGLKADYMMIPEERGKVGEMARDIDWQGLKDKGIEFYNNKDYDHDLSSFAPKGYYVKSFAAIQTINFSVGVQYRF